MTLIKTTARKKMNNPNLYTNAISNEQSNNHTPPVANGVSNSTNNQLVDSIANNGVSAAATAAVSGSGGSGKRKQSAEKFILFRDDMWSQFCAGRDGNAYGLDDDDLYGMDKNQIQEEMSSRGICYSPEFPLELLQNLFNAARYPLPIDAASMCRHKTEILPVGICGIHAYFCEELGCLVVESVADGYTDDVISCSNNGEKSKGEISKGDAIISINYTPISGKEASVLASELFGGKGDINNATVIGYIKSASSSSDSNTKKKAKVNVASLVPPSHGGGEAGKSKSKLPKKASKKKTSAKDSSTKPKRPLNSYNFFFRYKNEKLKEYSSEITNDCPAGMEDTIMTNSNIEGMSPDDKRNLRRDSIKKTIGDNLKAIDRKKRKHRKDEKQSLPFLKLNKLIVAAWNECDEFAKEGKNGFILIFNCTLSDVAKVTIYSYPLVFGEFQGQAKQLYQKELSEMPKDEKPVASQKKPTSGKKSARSKDEVDLTLDDSDDEDQSQLSEGKGHELEEGQKQSAAFLSASAASTEGTGTSLSSEEEINLNSNMTPDANLDRLTLDALGAHSGGSVGSWEDRHNEYHVDEEEEQMSEDQAAGNVLNTTAVNITSGIRNESGVLSSNDNTIPRPEVVDNGKVAGRAEEQLSTQMNSTKYTASSNTITNGPAILSSNDNAIPGSEVVDNGKVADRAEGGMNSTNTVSSNSASAEQNLSTRNNINDTVHHQSASSHPNNIMGNHQYNNTSQGGNDFGYDLNSLSKFMNERSGDIIRGCCGCIGCGMFLVGMIIYSSAMVISTVMNIYYLKD